MNPNQQSYGNPRSYPQQGWNPHPHHGQLQPYSQQALVPVVQFPTLDQPLQDYELLEVMKKRQELDMILMANQHAVQKQQLLYVSPQDASHHAKTRNRTMNQLPADFMVQTSNVLQEPTFIAQQPPIQPFYQPTQMGFVAPALNAGAQIEEVSSSSRASASSHQNFQEPQLNPFTRPSSSSLPQANAHRTGQFPPTRHTNQATFYPSQPPSATNPMRMNSQPTIRPTSTSTVSSGLGPESRLGIQASERNQIQYGSLPSDFKQRSNAAPSSLGSECFLRFGSIQAQATKNSSKLCGADRAERSLSASGVSNGSSGGLSKSDRREEISAVVCFFLEFSILCRRWRIGISGRQSAAEARRRSYIQRHTGPSGCPGDFKYHTASLFLFATTCSSTVAPGYGDSASNSESRRSRSKCT